MGAQTYQPHPQSSVYPSTQNHVVPSSREVQNIAMDTLTHSTAYSRSRVLAEVPIPQPTHPPYTTISSTWVKLVCIVISAVVSAFKIFLLLNCASNSLPHTMYHLFLPFNRDADRTMLQLCGLGTPTASSISRVHSTGHSSSRVLANSPTNPTGT